MKRILFYLLLIIIQLLLQSCPHVLVTNAEKMKGNMELLKEKRNNYRIQNQDFKTVMQLKNDYQLNISEDTLRQIISENKFPFRLEITKTLSDNFPNKIELHCTVYDTMGKYIGGLAPPYFKGDYDYKKHWHSLFDSCLNSNELIQNFDVEEVRNNKDVPYSIMFVLDHSPSMGNSKALKLQQAVQKVLYAIKPTDYIGVVKFTSKLYYEVELTDTAQKYRNQFQIDSLDRKKYKGGTAMYDALTFSIEKLSQINQKSKKIIILFSDGGDNSSKIKFDSTLKLARNNKVSVYSIAYGVADSVVEVLSRHTGGKFYQILSSKEFPYVFKDIYTMLNNYYLITYRPQNCLSRHFVRLNFDLLQNGSPQMSATTTYDKSILSEFDLPGTIVMLNIEFDVGSYQIKENSIEQLKNIAQSMLNNTQMKIKINGHTDDVGTETANKTLSEQRANEVKRKLIEMGIESSRLEVFGHGESKPLAPNTSDENRKKNRRTEFEVIK